MSEPKMMELEQADEALLAQAMVGRMLVRWDETVLAMSHRLIVFFAEFRA